jgi:4-aminobutyrate aminotransferase-like enzyme
VPLGATVVNKKIADHFDEHNFPHSYTYSGHALACATSMAVIDFYYKEKLADRAAKTGEYMMGELRGMQDRLPVIGDIRGLGLFMGIELVANPETKEKFQPEGLTEEQRRDPEHNPMVYLNDKAKEKGLIFGSSPGTGILRMMPYLIITKEQVDEGLKLLEEVISETCEKFDYPKKE